MLTVVASMQKWETRVNILWCMPCVSVYCDVCFDGVSRVIIRPDSARVGTFWRWRSLSFSLSTVCCSCGSSWSPSLAGPPRCGPVGKSGLQLVFPFSLFLCQSGGPFILTCRVFSTSQTYHRLHFLHDMRQHLGVKVLAWDVGSNVVLMWCKSVHCWFECVGVFLAFCLQIIYFFHVLFDCNLFEINISYGFGDIKAISLLCQQLLRSWWS